MSFHVHEHGNGGNVTEGSDDIGMESKEAARESIICRHTDRKLKQFSHERIDEGICVPFLFWTGYDPNTKNYVPLEALFWRDIVIENPRGMFLLNGAKPSVAKPSAISR